MEYRFRVQVWQLGLQNGEVWDSKVFVNRAAVTWEFRLEMNASGIGSRICAYKELHELNLFFGP